jgi:acetyltransferase-like isoleucine patch superfamily enzyme
MNIMNDKDREPVIHETAEVDDTVEIGDWSVIHSGAKIYGDVTIGRAAWITEDTIIGGGQMELGSLRTGDFLHMGIRSFINIADTVVLGHEVGLGMETKLFTHGGFLNIFKGFPYQQGPLLIEDEVWLPKATVLPDLRIGSCVVVAAESVVNRSLPDGCLAGGIPARIIEEGAYYLEMSKANIKKELDRIKFIAISYGLNDIKIHGTVMTVNRHTKFYPLTKSIQGYATKDTEIVKDLFRRIGVRFRYYDNGGEYTGWD